MAQATLFQFSLCPFCHKVKAGLELKNIAYDTVEVSPRSKSELPELPEDAPKKVPVFRYGEEVLWDSTVILKYLDSIPGESLNLLPEEEAAKAEALRIEEWVDDSFTQVLPTVLYGSWKDAWRAAKVTAECSKLSRTENMAVRYGGSIIMKQISKRILKRHGKNDPQSWLNEELDVLEKELGDKAYLGGEVPNIADAAAHGALKTIEGFSAFTTCMDRAKVASWYARVNEQRNA
jgi:glutathione S-transferase